MKLRSLLFAFALALLALPAACRADDAPKVSALTRMPVREVTIFKDGYAFVRHEGDMPTDADGNVDMDYLPTPVLGTFWPYSSDPNVRLVSVTSSRRRVEVDRTATTLKDMFRANVGADVYVYQTDGDHYSAAIVGFPTVTSEELGRTNPPGTEEQLPIESDIVLLKTNEGIRAIPFDQIQSVTFKNGRNPMAPNQEFRNMLKLQLGWQGKLASPTAKLGLLYLQSGLKWTPAYRITLGSDGTAHVELRATIENDLVDLDDVTANLVIGVPTFKFKDTTDPIALQQQLNQPEMAAANSPRFAYAFSNAIQSQVAANASAEPMYESALPAPQPTVSGAEKAEDLFVFTVSHLTLHRGERAQVPVADYTVKYSTVYKLDIPINLPSEVPNNNLNADELQAIDSPHVIHAIRFENDSKFPITTAPALIVEGDKILAQGMTNYTAIGGKSDLDITNAVDVPVNIEQHETKRTPDAYRSPNGNSYTEVDQTGTVTLTNYRTDSIDLVVNRYVAGTLDSVDHDGTKLQSAYWGDAEFFGGSVPDWWNWFNWPYWWSVENGTGKATWKITLAPGETVHLGYTWHYMFQQ